MRTLLFFIIIHSSLFAQDPEPNLYGKWQLKKVETKSETINPRLDFFLTISCDWLQYNLDVNTFVVYNLKINKKTISYNLRTCTQRCCDGAIDAIAYYLNYCGNYKMQDSLLIFSNKQGKL